MIGKLECNNLQLDTGQSSDSDQLLFGYNKPLTHSSRCENTVRGTKKEADIREYEGKE